MGSVRFKASVGTLSCPTLTGHRYYCGTPNHYAHLAGAECTAYYRGDASILHRWPIWRTASSSPAWPAYPVDEGVACRA